MFSEDKFSEAAILGTSELDLRDKHLKTIPFEVEDIKRIKVLNLRGNDFEEIPEIIFSLPELNKLDLSNNGLKSISPNIRNLISLKILYLGGNELSELPEELSELTNLEELYLTYNKFKEIPKCIFNLYNLKYLFIGGNQISFVPNGISRLSCLTSLNISYNLLDEIPYVIFDLKNLKELYLGANEITVIPESIAKLRNLTVLNLSYNEINEIPLEITRLKNLTVLMLNQNQISAVPKQIAQLNKLKEIGLSCNQLKSIPKGIIFMDNLSKLSLFNNPLNDLPIDIANRGINEIRYYYSSLNKSVSQTLYEAKLVIVGEGDVGKTSIRKKIIDNDYIIKEEKPTEGIEISKWTWNWQTEGKEAIFTVNIWDFSGQEINYSTHQFFLTERSLYLFVWEARKEENYASFDYWLTTVSTLGKNSPVIVILNKIDIMRKEIDEAYYKEKFPNIICFHQVSCSQGTGIKELVNDIKQNITSLPQVGIMWPYEWLSVRNELKNIKKEYLEYSEYLGLCCQNGLDEEKASYLSRYLYILGVILHYQDDYVLKGTVILNPEWASKAVYKLLKSEKVETNNGRIAYEDLEAIWKSWGYQPSKHMVLLHLMLRFELCFKVESLDEYIIPQLLPLPRPYYIWDFRENLAFEYHYDYVPTGIIARFIVRTYSYVDNNLYWRNGLILKDTEGSRALIFCDTFSKKIKISISGDNKRDFLVIIRNEFDYIHQSLNEKRVKEMVPCVCDGCSRLNTAYFYEYNFLKDCLSHGVTEVLCHRTYKNVSINKLLYGVEDTMGYNLLKKQDRYEEMNNVTSLEFFDKSIFASYEKLVDKLLEYIERNNSSNEDKQELLECITILKNCDKDESKKLHAKERILKFIKEHADKIGTTVFIEVLKRLIMGV